MGLLGVMEKLIIEIEGNEDKIQVVEISNDVLLVVKTSPGYWQNTSQITTIQLKKATLHKVLSTLVECHEHNLED